MNAFTAKSIQKYQHPVFDSLSEKALVAFYSLGNTESLQAGALALQPCEHNSDSFLILSGHLELINSETPALVVYSFTQGDFVPNALYQHAEGNLFGLRARSGSSVFRFSEEKLASLDPEIQLLITKKLVKLTSANNQTLLQQQSSLSSSKQILARQILEELEQQMESYTNSKPIKNLLNKIPRLPSYVTRLTQMLADKNVSTKEAFETAKLDPSLTASVLKTVNSAAYGLRHKVMDFQHAFVLLGFNQIQQIIINRGIQSTMPKAPEFQQLQLHCVMVSALCQEISLALKQGNSPLLGTIGLLHDIGQSVVLLLKREHTNLTFLINLLNSDLVGTMLLREWEIPEDICACMQYQSIPYQAPPYVIPEAHRLNMSILYVAHLCFDFMMDKDTEGAKSRYFPEYMTALGCDATSLEEFISDVLMPSVQGRMSSLPKVIQNFLQKGLVLCAEKGEAPKLALDAATDVQMEA